jgi:hypothetical protein
VSWTVDDPEHVAAVGRAGAPPPDFEAFFANETWAWIWASWSASRISAGDSLPYHLYRLTDAVLRGASVDELHRLFVGRDAEMPVPFPPDLEARVAAHLDTGEGDEAQVRRALWDAAMEWVHGYYAGFWSDVQIVQQQAGGGGERDAVIDLDERRAPARSGFTREMVVESMVDEINEERVKRMGPGTFQPFWQHGNLVLIGPGHYDPYYDFVQERDGSCTGYVTLESRAFGTSVIRVTGSNDEAGFKEAIRRFSRKRIEFT